MYAAMIDGDLVVPYCYGGNEELVGVYFGWKRLEEYWFARFSWLNRKTAGFAFLKQESLDLLTGAWWYDSQEMRAPSAPPDTEGVPATLEKRYDLPQPACATSFLEEVRREGLASRLTRHSQQNTRRMT